MIYMYVFTDCYSCMLFNVLVVNRVHIGGGNLDCCRCLFLETQNRSLNAISDLVKWHSEEVLGCGISGRCFLQSEASG